MSFQFDPTAYGPAVAALLQTGETCELGPGKPRRELEKQLRRFDVNSLSDRPLADREMGACCVSGLWLLHNFLDESHQLSQDIETSSGSYWHGIMHRREPDFPNSKYWFRRVGSHPIFPTLHAAAREHSTGTELDAAARFLRDQADWDPFAFVDLCEAATRGQADSQLCRELAQLEWQILFDYCYRAALGG